MNAQDPAGKSQHPLNSPGQKKEGLGGPFLRLDQEVWISYMPLSFQSVTGMTSKPAGSSTR